MAARILVPLDQSSVAESALPLARRLARQLDARVTLISVLNVPRSFGSYVRTQDEPPPQATESAGVPTSATPQSPYGGWNGWSWSEPSAEQINDVAERTSEAERYLAKIANTFESDHVETIVLYGQPADRLLGAAESRDGAIIVLASHGRSGVGRAVVGSVAARVVQAARNPVFMVRATKGADGSGEYGPINRILIPVDGSTFSEQAIPVVAQLFKSDDLQAHLLQVLEAPVYASRPQADGYTAWLAEKVSGADMPASWEVTEGDPANQINAVAKKVGVDLVAMSTHGRTGLNRFVLGSVAERVLHNAERPLLLIPARK